MNVEQLRKALKELGYAPTELVRLRKAQLIELYEKETNKEVEAPVSDIIEEEVKIAGKDSIVVYDNIQQKALRVYSKEVHGADYKKLAEKFVEKFPHCSLQ